MEVILSLAGSTPATKYLSGIRDLSRLKVKRAGGISPASQTTGQQKQKQRHRTNMLLCFLFYQTLAGPYGGT